LNIIKKKIWKKTEINLGDQFGFKQGLGTKEAILALKTIPERRLNMNRNTYIEFIDLEKAFDIVNWNLLMTTLKRTGLDWRNRKIIMELYKNQETTIKIGHCISTARICRGVRQGCSLSPYLFNIFIEVVQELKIKTKGVKINGKTIYCIRFTDDIAMVTETAKDIHHHWLHLMRY
jgi:retron-type reverse transcriptase